MKISLISANGNTDVNLYTTESVMEHLKLFSGRVGKKCYSPLPWDELSKEPAEKGLERAKMCLDSKHHSIYDHAQLTFSMSEIPKFILMILNNEYCYTTSEQSARWTNFAKAGRTQKERDLYVKWQGIIKEKALAMCPDKYTEKEADKLGQENARYMLSSFTETSIIYTASVRQFNYMVHYMEEFLKSDWGDQNERCRQFMDMLTPYLEEFIEAMKPYIIEGLIPKSPRELAIFKNIHSEQYILDTNYKVMNKLSVAAYAQFQRHRTIRSSVKLGETAEYFIPKIVYEAGLEEVWLKDLESVADVFPQAMLLDVVETGEISDFVSKCYERCCGRAQHEIQEVTNNTLEMFRKFGTDEVKEYLKKYTGDAYAACAFPYHKCTEPCKFGVKQRERLL